MMNSRRERILHAPWVNQRGDVADNRSRRVLRRADTAAVVVVNYNSATLLESNFTGISRHGTPVVVVDNGSCDDERARIEVLADRYGWHLTQLERNCGFGGGVNVGVKYALRLGAQTLILVNPDARVDLAVIDALHEQCTTQRMALVAPRIVDSSGHNYFNGAGVRISNGNTVGIHDDRQIAVWSFDTATKPNIILPWITGACMAFSRELWWVLEGMDDRYFLYWEDVDFSYRAYLAGARIVVRRDLTVIHDEGGTQKRSGPAKSAMYYYFNCRNRLLFGARYLDRRGVLRWVCRTPSSSWAILMRGGRRQLLFAPQGLAAAIAGSVVGAYSAIHSLFANRQLQPAQELR